MSNCSRQPISPRIGRFTRLLFGACAITFFGAAHVFAQPLQPSPLDPRVVASVDRLYPGFTEILDTCDSASLPRLARTLSANPGEETLSVLLSMLERCPSWSSDAAPATLQIGNAARASGRLPLAPLSRALLNGDADQRASAAVVLSDVANLIPSSERDLLQKALIAALSDRHLHVREWVAAPLRALGSAEGEAALARSLEGPDVTDMFYWRATGRKRPFTQREPTASSFPAATGAAVGSIAPDFLNTLSTREDARVRQLIAAIERARNPDATPVLVWLLANGDMRSYGGLILNRLTESPHVGRLPIAELAGLIATTDPDPRLTIAELFSRVLQLRGAQPSAGDRERIINALVERLHDRYMNVRVQAAEALGRARATDAVRALTSALDEPDISAGYASTVIRALASIGSREALPALERWARSARTQPVREDAARAFIAIAKPADPGSEARRLLWEQPDTDLERDAIARGHAALPLAWQALANGSARERRAAAALLGWFPHVKSIQPILSKLAARPGAVTRDQLLFDLNMILLADGSPADPGQRNALAAAHLQWLYDQIANQRIDSDIRSTVLAQKTIAVFPDRVVAPFSLELSPQTSAVRFESPQAFLESVAKDGCGVAFHAITVAEGVARVATTLYLPRGRIANQVWIGLYRNDGGRWVPLQVPPHPVLHGMLNEPNLLPAINRNYGGEDPLKILRLDLTMERIRVDPKASQYLPSENRDNPQTSGHLDASYVRLLEKYKRSDAASVRYTAEFESARLTGQPDVQLWMDTLAQQPGSPFQAMAQQVIAEYALRQIKEEGRELAGAERDQLVAAALNPEPVDARLLPQQRPRVEHIRRARRSTRFGLVDAVFGSGNLGMNGYSMLFERRGDRWVFVCVVSAWIS